MKKSVLFFLIGILFISCKQSITDVDVNKINGYWEIEKVILKDGEKKDFKVNETIDFFMVKEKKGFRQKVMPQFDGTFKTNDISEAILVTNDKGNFYINYSTEYGKWKEEILEIKDSILVLKNKDNLEYHYKKHTPFSLK
jgi:hypothetical protein